MTPKQFLWEYYVQDFLLPNLYLGIKTQILVVMHLEFNLFADRKSCLKAHRSVDNQIHITLVLISFYK